MTRPQADPAALAVQSAFDELGRISPDIRRATEWATLAASAAEPGCDTVLSVPLPVLERVQGALTSTPGRRRRLPHGPVSW